MPWPVPRAAKRWLCAESRAGTVATYRTVTSARTATNPGALMAFTKSAAWTARPLMRVNAQRVCCLNSDQALGCSRLRSGGRSCWGTGCRSRLLPLLLQLKLGVRRPTECGQVFAHVGPLPIGAGLPALG